MTTRRRKKTVMSTLRKAGYAAAALSAIFVFGGYFFGCFEDVYILITNTKNIPTYGVQIARLEAKAERDSIGKIWRAKHEREQDSLIREALK